MLRADSASGTDYAYTYDNAGNILSVTKGSTTYTYTYGDSDWGDLLTAYDGQTFTYDTIGNLTDDGTWDYTWQHGRQLATMTPKTGSAWNFTYDADGLRTKRTNGSTTYSYIYNGDKLSQMTVGSDTLKFAYDASGTPLSVEYNGTTYYYVTNIQGDVTSIVNTSGTTVVEYTYDAWGTLLSTTGSMATSLGEDNPLRYRGYVYDTETALYYLQSRYYNPHLGRFINADNYPSTGQGLLGNNTFAYCNNNPVIRKDSEGAAFETVWDVVSLGMSIIEVAQNPRDPWAWVGLAGDLLDVVIPFVGGIGEVTRGVKIASEALDTASNITKADNLAPIVIGENMKRVRQYAEEIGGHAYRPWKNDPFDYDTAMRRNKRWINDMMNDGREIIDIGPDFARRRSGVAPSDFYNMERSQVKGYSRYRKAFVRQGAYGGVLGEW